MLFLHDTPAFPLIFVPAELVCSSDLLSLMAALIVPYISSREASLLSSAVLLHLKLCLLVRNGTGQGDTRGLGR